MPPRVQSLSTRSVSVLTSSGGVRALPLTQLRGKVASDTGGRQSDRGGSVAVDRTGASLCVGDVITVDMGEFKGEQ